MLRISGICNSVVFKYLLIAMGKNGIKCNFTVIHDENSVEIIFCGSIKEDLFLVYSDLVEQINDAEADVELVLRSSGEY